MGVEHSHETNEHETFSNQTISMDRFRPRYFNDVRNGWPYDYHNSFWENYYKTTQMKPTTLTSLQDGLFLQDQGWSLTCGTTKHCFLRPALPVTGPQCTRIRITQGEPTEASPTTWPWLGG